MSNQLYDDSAINVQAQETPKGPDQPYMHGYKAEELKNWCPEADPYAKYFRSHIPLAKRIDPFQPTQAHPVLTNQAKLLSLSADYDKEEFFGAYRYSDSFSRNILRFWQYHDIYGSWHGLPVYGSSKETLDHGVINIPNPAYTDAAHRNGVLSLGCWFWPRELAFHELLEKSADGIYIIAKKMIEMADYFGFDGYFINQEASIEEDQAKQLMEMLKYMRGEGLYFSWYDCLAEDGQLRYVNGFNEINAPWVTEDDKGEKANDSVFMNYAYTPERLEEAADYARELGLDPYESLYAGIENDKFRFERGKELSAIFREDEARTPRTSLSLFGTDMVWHRGPNPFDPQMQVHIEERERMYWSGPNENPVQSGRERNSEAQSWPGIAHYIPEKSVIGSFPFVSRFNNGHGLAFYVDGKKSSMKPWNHVGIQDLLPTWQWWTEGEPISVGYHYEDAWNGGTSIEVTGDLQGVATLHLYKTELLVSDQTELSFTYKHSNPDVTLEWMFIFKDDVETPVYLDGGCKEAKDWQTIQQSLAQYSGRTIAMMGLRFVATEEKTFASYIGEVKLTDKEAKTPEMPTGFSVEKAYGDGEQSSLFLQWDFSVDETIWHYDIYRVHEGRREILGRVYDGVYYVKSVDLLGESFIDLELVAVGKDGTESPSAELRWQMQDQIETMYEAGPFPVKELIFNSDQTLSMEIGWHRYVYVRALPSYATNIHLHWSSSDESVARVSNRGVVTATGAGVAVITARAGELNGEEGEKVEIPVSVMRPVKPKDGVIIPAEKYDASNGIFNPLTYLHVRDLNFADWVAYERVDFGEAGVSQLLVHAAVREAGTTMEIRLGDGKGELLAEMELEKKSGLPAPHYHLYEMKLPQTITGKQTLHLTFKNPRSRYWTVRDVGIVDVDWFQFLP